MGIKSFRAEYLLETVGMIDSFLSVLAIDRATGQAIPQHIHFEGYDNSPIADDRPDSPVVKESRPVEEIVRDWETVISKATGASEPKKILWSCP